MEIPFCNPILNKQPALRMEFTSWNWNLQFFYFSSPGSRGTLGGFLRLRSTRKLSSSSIQKKIDESICPFSIRKSSPKNVAPGLISLVVRIFSSHFSEKWNWSPDSRETSLRYDRKLRQIPFLRWEVDSPKKSWPKMCQRLGGTKKELVPPNLVNFRRPNGNQRNVWTSDSERHRYAQTCLSSQFSGIPLKKKTANSEPSWATLKPEKKRRSYPPGRAKSLP